GGLRHLQRCRPGAGLVCPWCQGKQRKHRVVTWLYEHGAVLWWLGALSVVMCVGTLVALPLVVARLPRDYFTQAQRPVRRHQAQSPGARVLWHLGKHMLGILIVLVGVAL